MTNGLSANTKAILLLVAPLIEGQASASQNPLTPGEYKRLAQFLRQNGKQPADFLGSQADDLIRACVPLVEEERLRNLLGRGFQLSQAVERWQNRAIWVLSRADEAYPKRLKERLKEDAPAILYGCGDVNLLKPGGLAVVGSRKVDGFLLEYAATIGKLAAAAAKTVVSGGARGVDQAAMRGALEAGGKAVGVLADGLEKSVMNREFRNRILEGRLALVSPYDPLSGFNVGNAMSRNKLIYAFADAALVVESSLETGGTWAGAVEQLKKLKFTPVYIRTSGPASRGLEALRSKGALPWPEPQDPEEFRLLLEKEKKLLETSIPETNALRFFGVSRVGEPQAIPADPTREEQNVVDPAQPLPEGEEAEFLDFKVRLTVLLKKGIPINLAGISEALSVPAKKARPWVKRLIRENVLQRTEKPVCYSLRQPSLFDEMER